MLRILRQLLNLEAVEIRCQSNRIGAKEVTREFGTLIEGEFEPSCVYVLPKVMSAICKTDIALKQLRVFVEESIPDASYHDMINSRKPVQPIPFSAKSNNVSVDAIDEAFEDRTCLEMYSLRNMRTLPLTGICGKGTDDAQSFIQKINKILEHTPKLEHLSLGTRHKPTFCPRIALINIPKTLRSLSLEGFIIDDSKSLSELFQRISPTIERITLKPTAWGGPVESTFAEAMKNIKYRAGFTKLKSLIMWEDEELADGRFEAARSHDLAPYMNFETDTCPMDENWS